MRVSEAEVKVMDPNNLRDPSSSVKQSVRTQQLGAQGEARNWFQALIDKLLRR